MRVAGGVVAQVLNELHLVGDLLEMCLDLRTKLRRLILILRLHVHTFSKFKKILASNHRNRHL